MATQAKRRVAEIKRADAMLEARDKRMRGSAATTIQAAQRGRKGRAVAGAARVEAMAGKPAKSPTGEASPRSRPISATNPDERLSVAS